MLLFPPSLQSLLPNISRPGLLIISGSQAPHTQLLTDSDFHPPTEYHGSCEHCRLSICVYVVPAHSASGYRRTVE